MKNRYIHSSFLTSAKRIIAAAALALTVQQASAELFLVTVGAIEYFPDSNKGGKLSVFVETNRKILADVAADFSIDPQSLTLVYDTVADAILIVNKTDGTPVATEFNIKGGNTITSPDGNVQYRQAFLYKAGALEPFGSVFGRIEKQTDTNSALVKFVWVAQFQHSVPQTAVDEPSEIARGTFTTGHKFVPGR